MVFLLILAQAPEAAQVPIPRIEFDLARIARAQTPAGDDDIIVVADRDMSQYRLQPLPPSGTEAQPPVVVKLGDGAEAGLDGSTGRFGEAQYKITLKIPF